MRFSKTNVRWRRVIAAGFAVIALSFLIPLAIVTVYAFVLAFQVRGAPDQTSIRHFAASISPKLMRWTETVLTFLFALKVARKTDETSVVSGLAVGILAGVLSSAVTLFLAGRIGLHNAVFPLLLVALGLIGGFIGQKTRGSTRPKEPRR